MKPMLAMFRIPSKPPPRLANESHFSPQFVNFIARCLVKNAADRPTSKELLEDPFLKKTHARVMADLCEKAKLYISINPSKGMAKRDSFANVVGSLQDSLDHKRKVVKKFAYHFENNEIPSQQETAGVERKVSKARSKIQSRAKKSKKVSFVYMEDPETSKSSEVDAIVIEPLLEEGTEIDLDEKDERGRADSSATLIGYTSIGTTRSSWHGEDEEDEEEEEEDEEEEEEDGTLIGISAEKKAPETEEDGTLIGISRPVSFASNVGNSDTVMYYPSISHDSTIQQLDENNQIKKREKQYLDDKNNQIKKREKQNVEVMPNTTESKEIETENNEHCPDNTNELQEIETENDEHGSAEFA
eukprot:Lithocolla_globosa_v1_NODE_128_length_6012_cov_35.307202.p2 type:complete len:358 gc:universal NODE_128_length_6012_cov_35.307202:4827-3754(-)